MDQFTSGVEDAPIDPPIQAKGRLSCSASRSCSFSFSCCNFSYRVPTLRELYDRDRRLLRAIIVIVIFLNVPELGYILYPFMLFSTWIHESFHGLAGE